MADQISIEYGEPQKQSDEYTKLSLDERIKYHKKKLEKLQAKKKRKEKKFHKFKEPDSSCKRCKGIGHYWTDAGFSFNDKHRCFCTKHETKRYKKVLNNKDLTVKKHEKLLSKFYDNNSSHNDDIHDTARSW